MHCILRWLVPEGTKANAKSFLHYQNPKSTISNWLTYFLAVTKEAKTQAVQGIFNVLR
jgi:hypothetical protein